MDHDKGKTLLNALIRWTNADHEDAITLSRNDCCYIRDEIERLRQVWENKPQETMQPCGINEHLFVRMCSKCGWKL